ncbi:MAG: YdcF family protein [Bacteroidetes bacterium]|nr:YdcF family protein [Bacteroidota bacterium]
MSKIFAFFLNPLIWVFIILILSLYYFRKNSIRARKLLIASLIVFYVFSNSFICGEFMNLWESKITTDKYLTKTYDVGIVLGGGMITYDKDSARSSFRYNTDRILQTVRLYKIGKIKKMLISSGSGRLVYRDMLESVLLKDYLVTIGIPDSVILIDSTSDNTFQNAVCTAKILKNEPKNSKYLLITSAIHTKRAKACFEKQGIKVDIYATNKIAGKRKWDFEFLFLPSISAFDEWEKLLHEIFGYFTYWIAGYL